VSNYYVNAIRSGSQIDAFIAQDDIITKCVPLFTEKLQRSIYRDGTQIQLLIEAISKGYSFRIEDIEYTYYSSGNEVAIRNRSYLANVYFTDSNNEELVLEVGGDIQFLMEGSNWIINLDNVTSFPEEELGLIEEPVTE